MIKDTTRAPQEASRPRWRWRSGQSASRLSRAVVAGTPTLDAAHRATLLIYVRSLLDIDLANGENRVWLGAEECALRLGVPVRDVRWRLQNLISGGFLRNASHGGEEIYDLEPTLARLTELEAYAAGQPAPFVRWTLPSPQKEF